MIKQLSNRFLSPAQLSLFIVVLIYGVLFLFSSEYVYFWDNIQQTSKEAYWFYNNNFSSLLLPDFSDGSEIVGTGYHPPLMGIITALLWNIFGMHLWVSHFFIVLWAFVLAWQTYKLMQILFPENIAAFVLPLLLLDSTVLAQIAMASPDIVLLTALVASIRYIMKGNKWLLAISLLFLVLINGRGMFTGAFVFIFYLFFLFIVQSEKITLKKLADSLLPFLPAFLMMVAYLVYYFIHRGWFFSNPDSPWAEGWLPPTGIKSIAKNILAFFLRLAENGRVFIYATGLFALYKLWKSGKLKKQLHSINGALLLFVFLLFALFFYFAVTTRIVIVSRYYMGLFLVFSIVTFRILAMLFTARLVKKIAIVSLVFLLSGNFWIYPDKISKAWDATLAHLPWYELRKNCFEYMHDNHFDFSKVSGGFCLSGNQRYIDLKNRDLHISNNTNEQFFIYSNISNLDDEFIEELQFSGKWKEIKTFKKGFVEIVIFEKK